MRDDLFVKHVRDTLDISQTELADRLGVSPAAVCRWESRERGVSKPVRTLLEQMVSRRKVN